MTAASLTRRQGLALIAATPLVSVANTPTPGAVLASFSILADIARAVAPANASVSALVGADADAHVFEPTPADGRRVAQAELLLINGLGFEGWIERLVKVAGYRGRIVIASRGIAARKVASGHAHAGHDHGELDPHAWQNLAHGRRYAGNIAQAFITQWPAARAEVEQRLADYGARIDELDRRLRALLATIPRPQRRIVTSHDAFGYLAEAYGIDVFAAQGFGPTSQPTAAQVARLVRRIRHDGVRALFVENISDPRLIERIASEGGARVGGKLYSDALSAPGGPADSYLKLVEHNVRTIAQALGAS